MRTHYDILKVAPDAPVEVVRAAYRALTQRYHPDRNPGDAHAARMMQRLNDAYAVLADPGQRGRYDASIAGGTSATARPAGTAGTSSAVGPAAGAPSARGPSAHAAREYARHASPRPSRPVGPETRKHRRLLAALVLMPIALGAGGGMWLVSHRETTPIPAASASVETPEWGMRALDPPQPAVVMEDEAPRPPEATAGDPAAPVAATGLGQYFDAPMPTSAPAAAAQVSAAASGPADPLPIVADPNGRAWPFVAGYVPGLRQDFADGLATVTADNRGNPAPVFLKLVSLDHEPAQAVRHVYIPALEFFTIRSIRPGRYELQFQNLVTGEMSRSGAFELKQYEGRYSTRYSELDITLYRVPGGELGAYPLPADRF